MGLTELVPSVCATCIRGVRTLTNDVNDDDWEGILKAEPPEAAEIGLKSPELYDVGVKAQISSCSLCAKPGMFAFPPTSKMLERKAGCNAGGKTERDCKATWEMPGC